MPVYVRAYSKARLLLPNSKSVNWYRPLLLSFYPRRLSMGSVRQLHLRTPHDNRQRVGDLVVEVARRYAAQMNESDFATLLRSRKLDRRRYVAFIASLYPCVIG